MKMEKTGKILMGLALLASLAAAGCAGGGYYPTSGYGAYRGSGVSDVPPDFYNYDPTLRQWYTAPYWNPTEQ
jgi:hypothetical protein